jgi:hypothetical protein
LDFSSSSESGWGMCLSFYFMSFLFHGIAYSCVAGCYIYICWPSIPTTSADLGCHWIKQTQLSEMAASLRHCCVFTRRTFDPTLEKPIGNLATGRACSNAANLCKTTNTWTVSLEIAATDSNKVSPSDSHEPWPSRRKETGTEGHCLVDTFEEPEPRNPVYAACWEASAWRNIICMPIEDRCIQYATGSDVMMEQMSLFVSLPLEGLFYAGR